MSSSIFHKILRTQSPRIFSLAAKSPPPPPLIHRLPVCQPTSVQFPLFNGLGNADPSQTSSRLPCFSLGFFLNPETAKTDLDGVVSGDAPTVWADSVKKKRKKKMNKHKLKKLRKRNSKKT